VEWCKQINVVKKCNHNFARRRAHRRGSILIVAMVTCFTLAGMVLVLCRTMATEAVASANTAAQLQASTIEFGAEQYVLGAITDQTTGVLALPDQDFDAIQCGDGYFWVLRPQYDDPSLPVFGLVDESSKLNINTANETALDLLPDMDDNTAASIINWRNLPTSNAVLPQGANNDYYLGLPDSYTIKNYNLTAAVQFETVEELLLVNGITKMNLYGDGTAPPLGQTSTTMASNTGNVSDVDLSRGWYNLLTVYSTEPANDPNGNARRNVSNVTAASRIQLQQFLTQQVGHSVTIRVGRSTNLFTFQSASNMTSADFSKVFDSLTLAAGPIVGRINVNTAPPEVLQCIPNLSSSDVQKLISARAANNGAADAPIGWVIDALGQDAQLLGNLVTDRPSFYSADILAVSGNGRGFKRVRIVVDPTGTTPKIVYRRDITERGWPMDPQILATIRAGQFTGNDADVTPGAMP
jgi:DNA uptake protein ComE-like DNA-binding protein